MSDLSASAIEIFKTLQSFDYTVMLYGEDSNRVENPADARRMFCKPENIMVSIVDKGDDSLVCLYLGKKTKIADVLGLIQSLRTTSTKYNLLYTTQQHSKDITPKDFADNSIYEATQKETTMNVFDGFYGTSKTSYLKLGETAKLIIKHSGKINENDASARSKLIESILIENNNGERMQFPTNNLPAARAMSQHIGMGNDFADMVGRQITRMAQDFANLNVCTSYIMNNFSSLSPEAKTIKEACQNKIIALSRSFDRMYKSEAGYLSESKKLTKASASLNENADTNFKMAQLESILKMGKGASSKAILESVCNSMGDELSPVEEEIEILDEAENAVVSVLGRPVDAAAWEKLKTEKKIDLLGSPEMISSDKETANPAFADKTSELLVKMGALVPVIKDNSLMNLIAFVVDRLPDETDPAIAKKMKTLLLYVLSSAGMSLNEGISTRNSAIRGFDNWVHGFRAKTALREYNEYSDSLETRHEDALGKASDEFSAQDFLDSDEWMDMVHGRTADSEDNILEYSEVKDTLKSYFTNWIDTNVGEYVEDTSKLVDDHLAEVITSATRDGFQIEGDPDVEMEDEISEPYLDATEDDEIFEADLTREDILLPNPNQGDSLKREVTPATAADPASGEEVPADSAYINRLKALSGVGSQNL